MRIMCGITALFMCVVLMLCFDTQNKTNSDYLRIHIRANSNASYDQSVKYAVKERVVDALVEVLAECKTKQQACESMQKSLHLIEAVANRTLLAYGFSYECTAYLNTEFFPTRSYEDLTLESGVYDALILELGEGKGDNWWCVVYPPLCFVPTNANGQKAIYKSKILEIIQNAFQNK